MSSSRFALRALGALSFLAWAGFAAGPGQAAGQCPVTLARGIPDRTAQAPAGSEVMAVLRDAHGASRDARVMEQVLAGNVPDLLRRLWPVTFSGRRADGRAVQVTVCVTPDYLAIGDDRDFVRVPLGLAAAARIAVEMGFLLPMPKMVDAIHGQARIRMTPQPMTPSPQMESTAYLVEHDRTLDGQKGRIARSPDDLSAGQKKDIVLTNRLYSKPGRVAIYGWHRSDGRPIQPLSTVHGAGYADYSHGVRLVSRTAFADGRAVDLADLIQDRDLAHVVSGEGPIADPVRLLASQY